MQVFWSYDHLPRMSEILFAFCVCVSCFKTLQLDLREKNMTQTRCMKQIREFSILCFFSCRHSFFCLYIQIYMMCDPWKLTWRWLEKSPSLEQGDTSTHSWLVFQRVVMLVFGGVESKTWKTHIFQNLHTKGGFVKCPLNPTSWWVGASQQKNISDFGKALKKITTVKNVGVFKGITFFLVWIFWKHAKPEALVFWGFHFGLPPTKKNKQTSCTTVWFFPRPLNAPYQTSFVKVAMSANKSKVDHRLKNQHLGKKIGGEGS